MNLIFFLVFFNSILIPTLNTHPLPFSPFFLIKKANKAGAKGSVWKYFFNFYSLCGLRDIFFLLT